VPIIQHGVKLIQLAQDTREHRRLLDWISPTNYPAQQSDIIKRRCVGTGQWFLDTSEVVQWLDEPKKALLCLGAQGAGKTMIAAIAIEHLLQSVRNTQKGVAYVYCNYKAEDQDASSMLAAILKQLLQSQQSTIEPVEKLHQQHMTQGTKPSLNEIYSTLQAVIKGYPIVHLVIDALDECQDNDGTRRLLLAKLLDLQKDDDVRIMITSRYLPEIQDTFNNALRVEIRARNEDIEQFVAGQMYRFPKCVRVNPSLQKAVQENISDAVDGM
jgi:Cdc6-like AAA superfamily ATPase